MKKSIALFLCLGLFMFSYTNLSAACSAGGEGATSCTFRTQVSILGVNLWSVKGSSVSCGSGSYACCNADSATCIQNSTPASIQ